MGAADAWGALLADLHSSQRLAFVAAKTRLARTPRANLWGVGFSADPVALARRGLHTRTGANAPLNRWGESRDGVRW